MTYYIELEVTDRTKIGKDALCRRDKLSLSCEDKQTLVQQAYGYLAAYPLRLPRPVPSFAEIEQCVTEK